MAKLQPGGQAAIINYNVPEPTSYSGRNIIELQFPTSYFIQDTSDSTVNRQTFSTRSRSATKIKETTRADVIRAMKEGFSDKRFFISNQVHEGIIRLEEKPGNSGFQVLSTEPVGSKLANINPDEVLAAIKVGKKLGIYRSMYGSLTYRYINAPKADETAENLDIPGSRGQVITQLTTKDPPEDGGGGPAETFSIEITSPGNGATILGPSTGIPIVINGTSIDKNLIIQKVEVCVSPNPSQQATQSKKGSWSNWTASDTVTNSGTYTITAKATDKDGRVNVAKPVTINASFTDSADIIKPNITITSPSASLSGPRGKVVVDVIGTASDQPGSGIQQVVVQIGTLPEIVAIDVSEARDYSDWKASCIATTEGLQTITATAMDKAGNKNQAKTDIKVFFVQPSTSLGRPRLFLIEYYRLSSYLGNYGAGRTIKTLTLLPGQKTRMSVRTFMSTVEDSKKASSILDSFTEESSTEFELSLGREQSDKTSYQESMQYEINASASANWGFGSAQISGGVSGGTNSTREEFAKNVSNVTQKHASKASAKRDINVETSYEIKEERREETTTEQELENINMSRTLNFIFRQMNQEFITFLHLTDIRVGFFYNVNPVTDHQDTWKQREVALPELDSLLEEFVLPEKRQEVRDAIINQLISIADYKGDKVADFVKKVSLTNTSNPPIEIRNYYKINRDFISSYLDPATQTKREIPGVVLSVNNYVLRTEAVIVDALLGQGDALDSYSHGLQEQTIQSKQLSNELLQSQIDRNNIALGIIKDKNTAGGSLFAQVFPCCPPKENNKAEGSRN
jgi:hypothetical protein